MAALDGFPDIKVADWMPVLMAHYGLAERLTSSDRRYWTVHNFCKNAKARRDKRRPSVSALRAQPDAAQLEGGQMDGVAHDGAANDASLAQQMAAFDAGRAAAAQLATD